MPGPVRDVGPATGRVVTAAVVFAVWTVVVAGVSILLLVVAVRRRRTA